MRTQRRRRVRVVTRMLAALASVLVLVVTGYGWHTYRSLSEGLTRSDALAGTPTSSDGDTNILIMGLDSRLDQNGHPLPAAVLAQLHAGDSSDGGYNTNVLMLLHVPGDGGRAQAISIPRDDYVPLPGRPDGVSEEKIKQAYGLAKDEKERQLRHDGVADQADLERQGREAGRREAVRTVQSFLGGIPIDHVVEVTLVGFYDLAKALGSVTVCLTGPTQDSYSGARFVTGHQQLDAAQALAFVRQRRDYVHPDLNFTDLDRARRQQAFLASAAHQLRQAGTFTDPARLSALIQVARSDVVLDQNFDLLSFLTRYPALLGGQVTFTTLPVQRFAQRDGQDVNLVDTDQVQATVRTLLDSGTSTPPAAGDPAGEPPLPPATLDVVNASGRDGVAAMLRTRLATRGLARGTARTDHTLSRDSAVTFSPDSQAAGVALASALGLSAHPDSTLAPGHERVRIGTDFVMPATPSDEATGAAEATAAPAAPASSLSGGGTPCVK